MTALTLSRLLTGIHQYGTSLIAAGKKDKAMAIFRMNRERHPEEKFVTDVGLARGYTALGDTKNAIKLGDRAQEHSREPEAEPAGLRAGAEREAVTSPQSTVLECEDARLVQSSKIPRSHRR